jgi:hypothetical protein
MNPRVPTKEELELIRESVVLPFLMDIVQKNNDQMELQTMTFKPLYLKAGLTLLDNVHKRLVQVKKELKQAEIKVWEHQHRGDVIDYKFVCRGYHNEFPIWKEHLRAELSVKMDFYMREVFGSH